MENQYLGHKKISQKLPIIALVSVAIILIGLMSMKEPAKKYKISSEEMLSEALKKSDLIRPGNFLHIYYNNDSLYRFIDLRPANEFIKGSIKGAINIPVNQLLSDEYENIFNQDEKINVLYCSEMCDACGALMLLKQLGYKNNRILQGDYQYIKENIIDNYAPMSGNFQDEKAKYDFAKIINKTGGNIKNIENPAPAPAPIKKSGKKQKEEEEGGC